MERDAVGIGMSGAVAASSNFGPFGTRWPRTTNSMNPLYLEATKKTKKTLAIEVVGEPSLGIAGTSLGLIDCTLIHSFPRCVIKDGST